MVTRRARRWLTRGTTIAVLVLLVVFVVATWVQGSAIERDWLRVAPSLDEGSTVVEAVAEGTVLLGDGDDVDRPGEWMLRNRDGWIRVGDVLGVEEAGVRRVIVDSSGAIRPGSGARFSRIGHADPPVALEDVVVDGPLGEYVGSVMAGTDDTWVVLVHGNRSDRTEAYRMLPVLREAGFPAIVPSYRNDVGAPPSGGSHHGYGLDEWRDVEAAVDYAVAAGARDVVLVGYGSGGSIVGTFLYQSSRADLVAAVVLDAPVLSLGIAIDEAWAPAQIPGLVVGSAKAFATFRYGVDWSELDHVSRADEWAPPVLILHGRDDREAPLRASAEFAIARIESTLLLTFPDAGYGASWNVDPDRYEEAVARFLAEHALGESGLEARDQDRPIGLP